MNRMMFAILCVSSVVAGCGEGEDVSAKEETARGADIEYKALISERREVVEELQSGVADTKRRAELEAKEKRLSEEIRSANQERLRRDQEEVRRQILEKRRGGT